MSRRANEGRPQAARKAMNPEETDRLSVYEYDRQSNYEQDTRLTAALDALVPEADLVHPDQRLFQTLHLITEYSWCEMHFEMRRAVVMLGEGDYLLAAQLLERAAAVGALPVRALQIMLGFLPQHSLLAMRETFPVNTTGLDSPGARNLRRVAMVLWQALTDALAAEKLTINQVIAQHGRTDPVAERDRTAAELAMVRQAMLTLDGAVVDWKQIHVRLVWTQLGGHPATSEREAQARAAARTAAADAAAEADGDDATACPVLPTSLSGQSIRNLRQMAERSLFPQIWDSVDETYQTFVPVGGTSW